MKGLRRDLFERVFKIHGGLRGVEMLQLVVLCSLCRGFCRV